MDILLVITCLAVALLGGACGFLALTRVGPGERRTPPTSPVESKRVPSMTFGKGAAPTAGAFKTSPRAPAPTALVTCTDVSRRVSPRAGAAPGEGAGLLGLLVGLLIIGAVVNRIASAKQNEEDAS